jgi:hypothetical protein
VLNPKKADKDKASGGGEVYPDVKKIPEDTGYEFTITSVGHLVKTAQELKSKIRPGITDEAGIFDQIMSILSQYDGECIAEFQTRTYSGNYLGYSPFTVIIYTDLEVGDTVALGSSYRCRILYTYAKQSGNTNWVYTQLLDRGGNSVLSHIGSYSEQRSGEVLHVSTVNTIDTEPKQEITVSWERPGDGKELTDTFEITVNPAPQENNNESGGGTDSGGGSW